MLNLYVKAQHLMQNLKDESGQDSIEYALLIAIIAVGVVASVTTLSTYVSTQFANLAAVL